MADGCLERSGDHELKLSGSLKFSNIMVLRSALESELGTMHSPVLVDFSEVSAVDSSALSLWCCCLRKASVQNLEIHPVNVPGDLRSIAELVGLEAYFS
ncbi:MAG: STAS domain-containing protein [Pontibacterium sp.]